MIKIKIVTAAKEILFIYTLLIFDFGPKITFPSNVVK